MIHCVNAYYNIHIKSDLFFFSSLKLIITNHIISSFLNDTQDKSFFFSYRLHKEVFFTS